VIHLRTERLLDSQSAAVASSTAGATSAASRPTQRHTVIHAQLNAVATDAYVACGSRRYASAAASATSGSRLRCGYSHGGRGVQERLHSRRAHRTRPTAPTRLGDGGARPPAAWWEARGATR
jgi:hypothetical protein